MSLSIFLECDVPTCDAKITPESADPTPIVNPSGEDESEFVIDQNFYLPDGWRFQGLFAGEMERVFCPEHTEADIGVEADIRQAKGSMSRPEYPS